MPGPWRPPELTTGVRGRPDFLARGVLGFQSDSAQAEQDEDESDISEDRGTEEGNTRDSGQDTRPNSAENDLLTVPPATRGGGKCAVIKYEELPFMIFRPRKVQVANCTLADLEVVVHDDEICQEVLALYGSKL